MTSPQKKQPITKNLSNSFGPESGVFDQKQKEYQ